MKIILLNGASSSGKSSIARELGNNIKSCVRFSMDETEITPNLSPEKGLRDIISQALDSSQNSDILVIDVVAFPNAMDIWQEGLENHDLTIIGVMASVEILKEREQARGDKEVGSAESQQDRIINSGIPFDFHVDTTDATPQTSAQFILEQLSQVTPSQRCDIQSP